MVKKVKAKGPCPKCGNIYIKDNIARHLRKVHNIEVGQLTVTVSFSAVSWQRLDVNLLFAPCVGIPWLGRVLPGIKGGSMG